MTQIDTDQVLIFTGPSLSVLEAARLMPSARVCPPAKRGDITNAAMLGVRTIVLIDGEMIYNPPPSPHEIRSVLRDGIEVIGAASLGALRAMELFDEGMIGIGWVYGAYMSGRIDADDELLSILDPVSYSAVTLPLVNVRYGLHSSVQLGHLSKKKFDEIIYEFSALYFANRTPQCLIDIATRKLGKLSDKIENALLGKTNIKQVDAMSCLRYVQAQFIHG